MRLTVAVIAMSLAVSVVPANSQNEKSLFDRLGGMDAITTVVDDFVGNVAADDRINGFFANTDIPHLKKMLTEQICAGTGGGLHLYR
jgi:hemoglobin